MNIERQAELLKVLGNPVRLKILNRLIAGDNCNVNKIVKRLKISQSTVSQHLKILLMNKIVSRRRDGKKICYSVISEDALKIVRVLK